MFAFAPPGRDANDCRDVDNLSGSVGLLPKEANLTVAILSVTADILSV